jgi:tRNA-dihydrouridine synthase B
MCYKRILMQPVLYLAPIMGVTNYLYRKVYSSFFRAFDFAVIPFINKGNVKKRGRILDNEILKENNRNLPAIVQVLTNDPNDILTVAENISRLGKNVVNWNLGCPFPNVVNKKRGGGFLPYIDEIKIFLDKVMPVIPIELSIKMRLGINTPDSIIKLMGIFNDYPIKEIIIHPRTVKQQYEGIPDLATFEECLSISKNEVVYNGDIFTAEDYAGLKKRFSKVNKWMIGRGALKNPLLPERIKNNLPSDTLNKKDMERIQSFHDALLEDYIKILSGERHVMDKMKEVMSYLTSVFPEPEKCHKKIIKTKTVVEYRAVITGLFEGG